MNKEIADKIIEDDNFYRQLDIFGDTKVYIYNYNSEDPEYFPSLDHNELRGLTITKEENGSQKIYHSIKKFYELNEVPETSYSILKNLSIKKIIEKVSGDLIQFILIDGELKAKTKRAFISDKAKKAQNILDADSNLQFFILDCYTNKWTPLFILNQDELVLIGVRDTSGNHLDLDTFDYANKAKTYEYTLDELIEEAKQKKDFEGWVVRFKGGLQIKLFTDWYYENTQES